MPRPIHFEIPADNPEHVADFYRALFGWKIHKWEGPTPYWLIDTGEGEPGINGGILPKRHPEQPCVNTIGVTDLDATIALAEKSGGKCVVPKMAVPGVGWLAYCKDTEGHIFGLMQNDPKAA